MGTVTYWQGFAGWSLLLVGMLAFSIIVVIACVGRPFGTWLETRRRDRMKFKLDKKNIKLHLEEIKESKRIDSVIDGRKRGV